MLTAALMLGACQSTSVAPWDTGARPRKQVDLPPGLENDDVLPPTATDPAALHWRRGQVVESIEPPTYLRTQDDATEPNEQQDTPPEPVLAAQTAYAEGRDAWRDGKPFDAIPKLQVADRLAPNQPEVLRLLGLISAQTGNRVRGAYYLKKAATLDPSHTETLFYLGRFAIEQEEWNEAIVAFDRALRQVSADPLHYDRALEPLLHYYLAVSLRRGGYPLASIDEYQQYLIGARRAPNQSRWARELAFLDRQHGSAWIAVGDLCNQLGDPVAALEAYRAAQNAGITDQLQIRERLLYTHLRLGQDEQALELVIDRVVEERGGESSMQQVRYLRDQDVDADMLSRRLRQVYLEQDRSGALALAIADLMTPAQGRALLIEHLQAKPDDHMVFNRMLQHWLLPADARPFNRQRLTQAIQVTAQTMTRLPSSASRYATALLVAVGDANAIITTIDAMSQTPDTAPMLQLIRAQALADSGRLEDAAALLESSIEQNPDLDAARIDLARVCLLRGDPRRAGEVLEPVRNQTDPMVVRLRVRVLRETDRAAEALTLLDRLIREGGAAPELFIDKAGVQLQLGNAEAAARTLEDALNQWPRDERLYAVLFELYDSDTGNFASDYTRLMRRLLGTIPHSRIARLKRAEWTAVRGDYDQAEALLQSLLEDNERDLEAMVQLIRLYIEAKRPADARDLIEAQLEQRPNDRTMLLLAGQVYQALGDTQKQQAIVERILLLEPPSLRRTQQLAALYLENDRPEDAEKALRDHLAEAQGEDYEMLVFMLGQALMQQDRPAEAAELTTEALARKQVIQPRLLVELQWRALNEAGRTKEAEKALQDAVERYPEHAADLGYQLASLVAYHGDAERAEQIMAKHLERFPDHAATNNDLGYRWAEQNKNLDQARRMIQIATDAEPDNAAYLDSMGWVNYKLSDFEESANWLRRSLQAAQQTFEQHQIDNRATQVVVNDHLGDALYRLGRVNQARRRWVEARTVLAQEGVNDDSPDLAGLEQKLNAKIEAVDAQQRPPVADLPMLLNAEPPGQAADEPADQVEEPAGQAMDKPADPSDAEPAAPPLPVR